MFEHVEQGTLDPNIRACIALTSWKKRINTVGLTIYNLFETCGPDYHIVLTLAEEEFPEKERELPRDLMLMNRAGVFEILWCKSNVRSFKKWLFCAAKYPKVPVISADDDCLYTCNYAEELYRKWLKNSNCIITNNGMSKLKYGVAWGRGPNTLYPPVFIEQICKNLNVEKIYALLAQQITEDDSFYGCLAQKFNIPYVDLHVPSFYVFHDTDAALSSSHEYDFNTLIPLYKAVISYKRTR